MTILSKLQEWYSYQSFKRRHRKRLRNYGPAEAWAEIDLWIDWIQEHITKESKITATTGHPSFDGMPRSETNVSQWAHDFVQEVSLFMRAGDRGGYDGNLRFASTAGLILVVWFIACARAKALDPRRRMEERERSLRNLRGYISLLSDAMFDVTISTRNFPGQPWDVTFDKKESEKAKLRHNLIGDIKTRLLAIGKAVKMKGSGDIVKDWEAFVRERSRPGSIIPGPLYRRGKGSSPRRPSK